MRSGLVSYCVRSEKTRGNGLKLRREVFSPTVTVVRHWNRLVMGVFPSLGVFKQHLDLALGDVA